jgi:hypothetical protein
MATDAEIVEDMEVVAALVALSKKLSSQTGGAVWLHVQMDSISAESYEVRLMSQSASFNFGRVVNFRFPAHVGGIDVDKDQLESVFAPAAFVSLLVEMTK